MQQVGTQLAGSGARGLESRVLREDRFAGEHATRPAASWRPQAQEATRGRSWDLDLGQIQCSLGGCRCPGKDQDTGPQLCLFLGMGEENRPAGQPPEPRASPSLGSKRGLWGRLESAHHHLRG